MKTLQKNDTGIKNQTSSSRRLRMSIFFKNLASCSKIVLNTFEEKNQNTNRDGSPH